MSKTTSHAKGTADKRRATDCTGPYRVGITSSIGAGKTTIGKMLEKLGVPVIDTDHLAHELLSGPNPTYDRVIACFGENIVDKPGGPINRKKLAAVVFAPGKPEARKQLEAIMHPAIRTLTREKIARHEKADAVVVLVPLLFEAQLEGEYHEVWAVLVDPAEQLQRVLADATRGTQTEAQVKARIAAQWPQEKKAALADRVIDNSGGLDDLTRQVTGCLADAKEAASHFKSGCAGKADKPADTSARNAEYRRILERFGAIGTQEALERMGDVATTEHKEAHASLSMTLDSCEDEGGAHHHDHQHELTVDVRMSVKQKEPPAGPPGKCKCNCGDTCRVSCACKPDCGCACKKPKPPVDPDPPCPPNPPAPPAPDGSCRGRRRGLFALIAFLAFLFAVFALIWMWPNGNGGHTGGGDTVIIVTPPPPITTPKPPVDPDPPVTPPSGDCTASVKTTTTPPDFIKTVLHNQVRWRVATWVTEYKATCGATVTGYDGFGRLVNVLHFGANFSFDHQMIVVYDGRTITIDRFEANNFFGGRSIYVFDNSSRLSEMRQVDGHQRPTLHARFNWAVSGALIQIELTYYDVRGNIVDRKVLSPSSAARDVLKRHFYLFDLGSDGKSGL